MVEQTEDLVFCHWHPKTETILRCYQCDTPICAKCARRTPVGYICPDCQRGRKQRFEQAKGTDYLIAGVASLILGGLASVLPMLGSWWYLLFLSPLAGTGIAEVVWRLVGRRYGQRLWWIVCAGLVIGALPALAMGLLQLTALFQGNLWGISGLFIWIVHVVLACGSATARLRLT